MEEKYLYGNKVLSRADIEEGAKASGLDVDTYLSKAGIRVIQDSYDYNGKTLGANDVVEGATASNMDFDTYLSKAGIKPISITPAAQPGQSDIYQNLGIERNEAAKILTGDGTIASPTPEYKFKDPWKQKVYDATKAEILSLEKQVKESHKRDFTAEKELEKKKRQLEKAVVNEQFENKDEYIGLYDIQEKKKVAVPKSDVPTMMNNFIRESKLNERGEEFVVPFEKMNPDAQRVVLYNFNQKYMTPDKLDDFLKEHNYTTEGGGERKLKNAVQNIESGVMEGVGSFVEYYGQQLNHPLKDGINQLVLEASIGAVTEKEFNDRLNNLVSSAEKDPSYGSRAAQSVAELSTPINAGAHPLQAMMSLTKNDIHETVFGAAKAEFEQIKANLPTWKSAQESDGVFYKDQLGDDTIEQAKGIADFGKNWLKTNPKYNEELLYGVAPKALGSSIPFLATGAATGATGYQFLSTATMAMLGHHQMAVQGYNEAIQAGGTARDAIMSSLVNGGMGMTEAIPIADLYTRLAKGSSGRLWNVLIQGSEEATQETLQQVVGNVSAKTLYDDSRSIMDGVVESVQASFLVGGVMGGLIYNKREGASKSDLALLDKLDEQRKIALQNINDAPKGSAVNLATGEIVTPEEITLGKTENETSFRDALEEDVLATEPVVQPESLDEIPDGWDVSYQGISGTLVRGEDGLYIRTDDNVDILVEGGLSDSTPEELGLKVSQPVTKATVRAKTKERTRNYNVKYKDGNEYFVSLDDPNNPDGFGDKVFKVNGDGTMTEMFYGRKANVNKKLAIINKALDASGLPARNSEIPSVEEKNILDKEAEAEEKKAKEPKKEGEKKQPEEDKTEPTEVVIDTKETPEAAINPISGIKSAADDNSIPNRVQSEEKKPVVEKTVEQQEVVKKQQKAQKKPTTKKKTNNPEVTKEVKKTRSANTLVGGDTVYNVDVAEDGFTDIEDLKSYMKENPDAEDVTITQELHDTIWPKKKSDPTLVTKEAHDKKFTEDLRLLETTKEVDKKATGMYGGITDAEKKGYISEEEADAQRKQVADLVTKRRKMEDIEQIDKMLKSEAIKAIQRLKFKNDSAPDRIYSMIIPLPTTKQAKAAWNAAMDIAIAAVKVGAKIIDAVNAAIEYLTDKGYKITGKQKADLLKNIEKEAGVYSPKNKVQLQRVLEKIFNLSSKQAALVADVADRMAVAYQNMGVIAEKNDYYTYLLPGISEAKNLDEALYQVGKTLDPNIEIINGFYSPIQKRLLEQKQDKFSAKKWMEIVGNKDEAKFTGVYDMLAAKKPDEQVSRNEIMQWMRDNRIQVVEVVKDMSEQKMITSSEENYLTDTLMDDYDYLGMASVFDAKEAIVNNESWVEKYNITDKKLIKIGNKYRDSINAKKGGTPKFETYQLEGEKTGYKEVLITLPQKTKTSGWEIYQKGEGRYSWKVRVKGETEHQSSYDTREEAQAFVDKNSGGFKEKVGDTFKSSHFDEPNILVHLRMNIRTSATGEKILFLEEIQSDWGQKGKKEGFGSSKKDADIDRYLELESKGQFATKSDKDELESLTDKLMDRYNIDGEDNITLKLEGIKRQNESALPSAPFVTDTNSWVKLGLKFALQHAIKEGATSIAWTTGEQQNNRYDLSKQVDEIRYFKSTNPKSGYDYSIDGTKNGQKVFAQDVKESELEGIVGKDVAKRIIADEGTPVQYGKENPLNKVKEEGKGVLSGEGLKVGGKGMIGFYGSPTDGKLGIVGNVAESLFGKGSVKTSEISVTTDVKYISFADAMKAFREGGAVYTESNDGGEREIEEEIEIARAEDNNQKFFLDTAGDSQKSLQPSITITPEMKAEVERGLPLFQGEKGYFIPSQRVIGAISNPDISSPLHELSHAFLDDVIKLMTQGNDMAFELYKDLQEFAGSEEGKKFYNEWKNTYDFGPTFDPNNYVFLQEIFARGFEQYLTTGKSNAGENVKGLFEAIKDFMLEIYNGIVEATLDINLSPKMISVYDKMMGLDVGYFEGLTPVATSGGVKMEQHVSDLNKMLKKQNAGEINYNEKNIDDIAIGGEYAVNIETKEYKELANEIKKNGVVPILIDKKTGHIIDGTHRALILKKMGIKNIPVLELNGDFFPETEKGDEARMDFLSEYSNTTPLISVSREGGGNLDTSSIVLKQASKKTTSTFGLNTKQWNKMLSDIQNDYKISQDVNQSIDNVVNLLTGSVDKVALAADLKNVLSSPEAMSRKSFSLLRQDVKSMLRGARDEKARMAEVRSVLADWIRMNRKQLNSAGAKLTTSVINRVNNIKREIDVDNTIDYLQRILDDADFRRLEQQREKAKAKLLFLLDPKTYVFKKNSVARGKKVDADTIDYLTKLHYNAVNMSRIAAITRMNDIVAALSGSGTLNNSPFFPTPQQISELQQELIDISFSGAEDMDLSELDVAIQAAEDIVEQGKQALNTEKEARKKERADFKAKMLEVFTNKGQAKKVDGPNMVQDFFIKEGNDFHSIQDRLSVHEKDTDTMNSTLEKKHGRAARNAETGENIDQLKLFKEIGKKITSILGDAAVNYGGGKGVKAAMLKSRQFAKIFKRMAVQNYLKAMAENMNVISYNDAAGNARTEELTMNQIAYAWGLWKNSESRENLKVEGVQRGQEFYDAIDQRLPQVMKDYVDYVMNELMPSMHPYLNSVYKQMYGLNLTKLDNYLPQRVINRPDSTKSYDLWDEFSMGNISPSAVKSRISHGQELAILDINKVIQQYVTQAIKFKHWAIPVKEMMLFYNDQDVMKAINEYHGNVYNQMINVYLQHWKGATFNIGLKLIDKFRKNTTIGLLGLKPVIAVYQMANMPSYMAAIPVAQYAKLSGKIFSGVWDGDTRAKIGYLLDSDYFQQRFNSGDMYEVRELMDRTKVKLLNGKLTYSEMMTFMIRLGDAGAIVFGGYPVFEHNYRKAKKNGATDAEAKKIGIDAWADATEYLQQSSASSRRSSIEFNPWVKLMTMFASQPRQYHRLAVSAARNLIAGRGDTKHNLKTLFVCHVMMPSLYQLAANGFDWDNDDQLTAALIGNLNSIIILGQLINSASLMINDRQAFDINSPVLSMFQNLMFAFQKMLTANDESKDWDSDDTAQTIYLFTRGLTPVIPLPTGAGSNYWKLYQENKEGGDVYREPFRLGGWSQDNLEHTDRAKKILLESRQEEQKKQLIEDDKWQEDMVWSTNNNKWMNGFAKQKSDAWFRTKKAYDEKIDQTDFYYDADADMWYKKE